MDMIDIDNILDELDDMLDNVTYDTVDEFTERMEEIEDIYSDALDDNDMFELDSRLDRLKNAILMLDEDYDEDYYNSDDD